MALLTMSGCRGESPPFGVGDLSLESRGVEFPVSVSVAEPEARGSWWPGHRREIGGAGTDFVAVS
jgi:hypothetical protein